MYFVVTALKKLHIPLLTFGIKGNDILKSIFDIYLQMGGSNYGYIYLFMYLSGRVLRGSMS